MKRRSEQPDSALKSPLQFREVQHYFSGKHVGKSTSSRYSKLLEGAASINRFQTLLDNATDAVFVMELPNAQLVDANVSTAKLYGLTVSQLLSRTIHDLVTADASEQLESWLNGQMLGDEKYLEYEMMGDQSSRWVDMHMTRVDFGGVVHAIVVSRDITDRVNNQIELKNAHARLEEKVLLRTRELHQTNQQLKHKNDQLNEEIRERIRLQDQRDAMQAELIDTARRAGMAEIATNVLHNIGNALNSVSVSGQLAARQLRESSINDVARVGDLLEKNHEQLTTFLTEDKRGKQLPEFINALGKELQAEQEQTITEIQRVLEVVRYMREIVQWQQNFAGINGIVEQTTPTMIIEDAMRITDMSSKNEHIECHCNLDDDKPVQLERNKVVMILVNLLNNAIDAIQDTGQNDGQILIEVASVNAQLEFRVHDNGPGINPENVDELFNHGFTTKSDGHGFGLHSSALAALEMGGSLEGGNRKDQRGAVFVLSLPLTVEVLH